MGNTTFTGNAIAAQKNKTGFVLFDSEIKQVMEAKGLRHAPVLPPSLGCGTSTVSSPRLRPVATTRSSPPTAWTSWPRSPASTPTGS